MNFLRNTLGVLCGLAMAGVIISLGVKINSSWVNYEGFFPFEHWWELLKSV